MINRVAKVTQVKNGYIISTNVRFSGEVKVYKTFREVIEALTFYFDPEDEL